MIIHTSSTPILAQTVSETGEGWGFWEAKAKSLSKEVKDMRKPNSLTTPTTALGKFNRYKEAEEELRNTALKDTKKHSAVITKRVVLFKTRTFKMLIMI